ncbi:hypothetical protein D3C85_1796640 [compost metagenome]
MLNEAADFQIHRFRHTGIDFHASRFVAFFLLIQRVPVGGTGHGLQPDTGRNQPQFHRPIAALVA